MFNLKKENEQIIIFNKFLTNFKFFSWKRLLKDS